MDGNEQNPSVETQNEAGPEVATRRLAVSLGRKILSDIVLGSSALTMIGVLKVLQSHNESIVFYGLETATTSVLTIWLIFLVLGVIPNALYERMNTIENFSFMQVAIGAIGLMVWFATFLLVSRFISTTVERLGLIPGS